MSVLRFEPLTPGGTSERALAGSVEVGRCSEFGWLFHFAGPTGGGGWRSATGIEKARAGLEREFAAHLAAMGAAIQAEDQQ